MSPIAINDHIAVAAPQLNGRPAAIQKPWAPVGISDIVSKIRNPIREVIGSVDLGGNNAIMGEPKSFLNLGLGDPSVFGNLPPPSEALDAITHSLRSGKFDGYPSSVGYTSARKAVADYFDESASGGSWKVETEDVVMTHGASGALEMAFSVLADTTHNIVIPRPLFTAYETMATQTGCELRYYDLLPEQNWEVDFNSLASVLDDQTAFVLINNPSNPCGSNFSEAHLREIARFAKERKVMILSDEVYAGMAWGVSGPPPASASAERVQGKFNRGVFTPYASVSPEGPALILGAVSKRWLAPGWRTGWVIVHDPIGVLSTVRDGLARWAFRIQGPSSTVQGALAELFEKTPEKFFVDTMETLENTGKVLFERLSRIPGMKPLLPQGAMYLMCGGLENFDFTSDAEFIGALKREENILILPGSCFRIPGFMRFVTTVPLPVLMEACDRIESFCARHVKA